MQTRECKKQVHEVPDGVLAQQAINGDEEAYARLIERYSSTLFHFIYRFLNDHDAGYDILQQVFLQLYISLPKLRTGDPLKPWLFRVARNRCLDELRRKHAVHFSELQGNSEDDEFSLLATIPDNAPLPEEVATHHDLQATLQRAIDGLPPKYRSVVLLRYAGQLSFAEIGLSLQMPEATAKTYFQRAKPLLRVALADQTDLISRN